MPHESTITPESFSELLKWLGGTAESDGVEYEVIRARLIQYFIIKGCHEPDRLADATIDRVSQKIPEIASTYLGDPAWYFLGVAAKIYLEWLREQHRTFDPIHFHKTDILAPEDEREFACLDKCLASLPEETRDLILTYYTADEEKLIRVRKQLADDLGISLSALHIRASRIRSRLHTCVSRCLDEGGGKVS